jgi:transcriptional regulator with XRE-family HTH domain
MSRLIERLKKAFSDFSYRHSYMESFLGSWVGAQIKALREARDLTQQQLADLTGMKQSRISEIENVNYGRWSIATLRRLAKTFDVALVVKFVSFGEVLQDIDSFSAHALVKPKFEDDPTFQAGPLSRLAEAAGGSLHLTTAPQGLYARWGTDTPEKPVTGAAINRPSLHRYEAALNIPKEYSLFAPSRPARSPSSLASSRSPKRLPPPHPMNLLNKSEGPDL